MQHRRQQKQTQVKQMKEVNFFRQYMFEYTTSKLQLNGKSGGYSIESAFGRRERLHVWVLRMRLLELLKIAVNVGRRLVLVSAATHEVYQRVRVVLRLPESLEDQTAEGMG